MRASRPERDDALSRAVAAPPLCPARLIDATTGAVIASDVKTAFDSASYARHSAVRCGRPAERWCWRLVQRSTRTSCGFRSTSCSSIELAACEKSPSISQPGESPRHLARSRPSKWRQVQRRLAVSGSAFDSVDQRAAAAGSYGRIRTIVWPGPDDPGRGIHGERFGSEMPVCAAACGAAPGLLMSVPWSIDGAHPG